MKLSVATTVLCTLLVASAAVLPAAADELPSAREELQDAERELQRSPKLPGSPKLPRSPKSPKIPKKKGESKMGGKKGMMMEECSLGLDLSPGGKKGGGTKGSKSNGVVPTMVRTLTPTT